MADGVRIRLREAWDNVPGDSLIVERDVTRPRIVTADTPVCSRCGVKHDCKTYHLQLVDGTVMVSTTIWDRLQGLIPQRWVMVNVVKEPPTQGIKLPSASISAVAADF